MARRRLDVEMVRRGLSASPSEAAIAIRSGNVAVGGRPAAKAGTLVLPEEPITLVKSSRRFVSRGGEKLDAALDRFGLDVSGARALDAGAATGGFTDCLLNRGAAHVIAVDVGYGVLDWRLREDARTTVMERTNVRDLWPEELPYAPDVVTADLSFISLGVVVEPLARCAAPGAGMVFLVKPQFEARRDEVEEGGVITDPNTWRRVLGGLAGSFSAGNLTPKAVMASPLLGPAGNAEFLVHLVRGEGPLDLPSFSASLEGAIEAAGALRSAHG